MWFFVFYIVDLKESPKIIVFSVFYIVDLKESPKIFVFLVLIVLHTYFR